MIKIQKSFINDKATLFLVATPIGNLDELSPRAIDILSSVNYIACEDTRVTSKLLARFNIKTKLLTYHNFNEENSTKGLIALLEKGNNIALVSDAGYPLIQDPGVTLINQCINQEYNVVPISGASAFINALVVSGLQAEPHLFYGFLSSKKTVSINELEAIKGLPYTLIFYEAPHRILKTLENMLNVLGNRKICIAREITKKYEEFIRGNLEDILKQDLLLKGEIVIVVEGYKQTKDIISIDKVIDEINNMINDGYKKSEAIKIASKKYNINKQLLYKELD